MVFSTMFLEIAVRSSGELCPPFFFPMSSVVFALFVPFVCFALFPFVGVSALLGLDNVLFFRLLGTGIMLEDLTRAPRSVCDLATAFRLDADLEAAFGAVLADSAAPRLAVRMAGGFDFADFFFPFFSTFSVFAVFAVLAPLLFGFCDDAALPSDFGDLADFGDLRAFTDLVLTTAMLFDLRSFFVVLAVLLDLRFVASLGFFLWLCAAFPFSFVFASFSFSFPFPLLLSFCNAMLLDLVLVFSALGDLALALSLSFLPTFASSIVFALSFFSMLLALTESAKSGGCTELDECGDNALPNDSECTALYIPGFLLVARSRLTTSSSIMSAIAVASCVEVGFSAFPSSFFFFFLLLALFFAAASASSSSSGLLQPHTFLTKLISTIGCCLIGRFHENNQMLSHVMK
mmetsp:Transcript_10415/g.16822  ORF Transcript_10415/g.16822 Transcript_10415/m.16822 type:complete len:404 (+) Transcript_10415:217-1428(+)